MDINSLLSPQDSPRQSPGPSQIPPKRHRKSKPSKATQSTDLALANPTPTSTDFIHNATLQGQPIMPSPPMIHPASALHSAATNISSTADSSRPNRQPSTPGMDTLADLASMQHHQQATRANAGGLRSTDIYESHSSTNPALPTLQGVSGALSGRSPLDTAMADRNPQASPPRTYSTASLSDTDRQAVAQLVAFLSSNPFAYESHVELIRLLHLGFRAHVYPTSPSAAKGDPHTYELLPDLQNAREAMDARFALGEDLWVDLIEDQRLLATTPDECVAVMESCQKAVKEEVGSTKLWFLYAEWILSLYKAANPEDQRVETLTVGVDENNSLSDEDKAIIKEVWSWQHIVDVLGQGTQATKWRIDDSHLLWSIYTELLLQDLSHSPSSEAISSMEAHFIDRLHVPHSAWDETFQTFSNFISQYKNSAYENIMATVNQQCRPVKEAYAAREMMELNIKRAQESSDKAAEWQAFSEYIEWELVQSRKKHAFIFELVDALYQRATLRFPTTTELWEGYVMFLNDEQVTYSRPGIPLLSVLDQSTRHCPWSGTLWSQYLLAAERQNMLFTDIDQIKHKATSTGLLDAGGLEEILQVYVAWCSFLRRRAFQQESTDEELDVAEVGIRSAIEDMHRLGEAKYGKEYQGDPDYRLERVYIKYLTQSRNWRAARESWKRLISKHGDSHEFWLRYYLWEMSIWGTQDVDNASVSPRPSEATKVLRMGLKRAKLDWPERLLQTLQNHCEDHENAEELQSSLVQIWKTSSVVKKRRETEAIEAYEVAQAQALQQTHSLKPEPSEDSTLGFPSGKRKREASKEDGDEEMVVKRTRAGEKSQDDKELAIETTSSFKRDRENATIIAKNLPRDVRETKIRQYFRDCGTINSLKIIADDDPDSATAIIEFETSEDVLSAQTKDMKEFEGREIQVHVGTGCTLFVANFPPTADEDWMRGKFQAFGDIVDIRFPSLKGNSHRRFCYVQFKNSSQANNATKLHNDVVEGNLKLFVKTSNPNRKNERSDALSQGREIHLRNLDWGVREKELEEICSKYGTVERTRIPKTLSGKSKGFAFVTFSNKDEARKALDLDKTKIQDRLVTVEIATKNHANWKPTTIIGDAPRSSYSHSDVKVTNVEGNNASSPSPSVSAERKPSLSEIHSRTFALLNLPDTVNSARVRALAEPYGPLVKIVLRHDHQGATIEYQNAADAGKAAIGLNGFEIAPGRKLGVGSVAEMKKQEPEFKTSKIGGTGGTKSRSGPTALQSAFPIQRPNRPEKGRRGGLGIKRGGISHHVLKTQNENKKNLGGDADEESPKASNTQDDNKTELGGGEDEESTEAKGKLSKSNADFKAMFLKE